MISYIIDDENNSRIATKGNVMKLCADVCTLISVVHDQIKKENPLQAKFFKGYIQAKVANNESLLWDINKLD